MIASAQKIPRERWQSFRLSTVTAFFAGDRWRQSNQNHVKDPSIKSECANKEGIYSSCSGTISLFLFLQLLQGEQSVCCVLKHRLAFTFSWKLFQPVTETSSFSCQINTLIIHHCYFVRSIKAKGGGGLLNGHYWRDWLMEASEQGCQVIVKWHPKKCKPFSSENLYQQYIITIIPLIPIYLYQSWYAVYLTTEMVLQRTSIIKSNT